MSKIGTKVIKIPSGIAVTIDKKKIKIQGSQGELNFTLPANINMEKILISVIAGTLLL